MLAPENDATRLTVTEDAAIRSRPMRFVVGRILGEDVLIEGIFRAVARKLAGIRTDHGWRLSAPVCSV